MCCQSQTDVLRSGLSVDLWHDDRGFKERDNISQFVGILRSDSETPRADNRKSLIHQLNLMDSTFKKSEVNAIISI